jgi:type I restriction enzyme R subunit
VPFTVDEEKLSAGFEQMCEEMELEDEEAKDFVQRKRSRWKEIATLPERIDVVVDKMLEHFLSHPDPNGFKAQLVAVDRTACALYKNALDDKLAKRGISAEWSDVIISEAQNSEPLVARFEYTKQKQDDLIDYFKLTPEEWEDWNTERHRGDKTKWRPPLKILIVCDRLLTGFDAPIEQVMYLDKPLRDHNLLQAIARTNRPLPAMKKLTGVIVDYFGVFTNMEKALNFDENIREESLIDWDALRKAVPDEVGRCMQYFEGIVIEDTRDCLLAALRRLRDPDIGKGFEQSFKSLERLWEAVSPDPALYPHRRDYNWLCGMYVAYRRRQRGSQVTYGELSAKTRELIEENTSFMREAETLPVFRIDKDYVTKIEQLPTPSDKAAALEAALTAELAEGDTSFTYQQLGERLRRLKERRDALDQAAEGQLRALGEIADEAVETKAEPERLGLTGTGEYGLFTVLRAYAPSPDGETIARCAKKMVEHLSINGLLPAGWSNSKGARMRVEQSLLAESWNPDYSVLGFDPDDPAPPFLAPAVDELAKSDAA